MSILEQAEGYLAGTGGMCVEDAARALAGLYKAAKEVVDAQATFRHDMKVHGLLAASQKLTKAIAKLAAVLEELQ